MAEDAAVPKVIEVVALADLQAEVDAKFALLSRRIARLEQANKPSLFDAGDSEILDRLFIIGLILGLTFVGVKVIGYFLAKAPASQPGPK